MPSKNRIRPLVLMTTVILTLFISFLASGRSEAAQSLPDGKIAFTLYTHLGLTFSLLSSRIYLMNPDGSGEKRLTPTDDIDKESSPSFSPDGTQIVFSGVKNKIYSIYMINTDGSNLQILPQVHGTLPVWSADGKYIAYRQVLKNNPDGLYVYDINLKQSKLMVAGTNIETWLPITWSSNSQQVIYSSVPPNIRLFSIGLNDTKPQNIKLDGIVALGISRDGKRFAVCRDLINQIALLKSLTDVPAYLTSLSNSTDICGPSIAWSPDNTRLVYNVVDRTLDPTLESVRIETLNILTRQIAVLKMVNYGTDRSSIGDITWGGSPIPAATAQPQ